jgi:hypothetical protein
MECKKVRDLELVRVRNPKSQQNEPVISLEDVQGAMIQSCSANESSSALVQVTGDGNQDITLALNRVSKPTQEVVFTDGATENAVVRRV